MSNRGMDYSTASLAGGVAFIVVAFAGWPEAWLPLGIGGLVLLLHGAWQTANFDSIAIDVKKRSVVWTRMSLFGGRRTVVPIEKLFMLVSTVADDLFEKRSLAFLLAWPDGQIAMHVASTVHDIDRYAATLPSELRETVERVDQLGIVTSIRKFG